MSLFHSNTEKYSFRALFLCLIVMLLSTGVPIYTKGIALWELLFYIAILLGLFTMSPKDTDFKVNFYLALVAIFSFIAYMISKDNTIFIFTLIVKFTFFISIAIVFFIKILQTKTVSRDTVIGTISIYILIGFSFSILFQIFYHINPEYIITTDHQNSTEFFSDPNTFVYFSFITMTTIGYGDIIPIFPLARMICMLEGLFSQVYLTVLTAIIIGKFLSENKKNI